MNKRLTKEGILFVISGPSGSGKDTVIDSIRALDDSIGTSISATTRPMRKGEAEGVNYYYKTYEEFDALIEAGDVLEWDTFQGNKYGTLKSELDNQLKQGKCIMLAITVPGALKIKELFPKESVLIFNLPPSLDTLKYRIINRGRESEAEAESRFRAAIDNEIPKAVLFDYILVNDDLSETVDSLMAIIKAESSKFSRNKTILNDLHLID
ncbi:MAG: guanylate kinase [Ruminococcaceae bacterium]|nr:guanylate kinase [Oscillospiraceae bacterium]